MKSFMRKFLWKMGYDLQRADNSGRSSLLAHSLIQITHPTVILDVGANEGQFALEILENESGAHSSVSTSSLSPLKIFSFEPLSKAHAVAMEKSKNYPKWKVYPRTALGDSEGEVMIHIAKNSASSSLFEMSSLHKTAAPQSITVDQEKTPITRLDRILGFREGSEQNERYYLKIDTQGFELAVLKGAEGILNQVAAIQVELSWKELYVGQPLALEVMQWLMDRGFQPYGFSHDFRDAQTKHLLQMDGFFIRSSE